MEVPAAITLPRFQVRFHCQQHNEPPGTISRGKAIKIAAMVAAWVALVGAAASARFGASGHRQAGQGLRLLHVPGGEQSTRSSLGSKNNKIKSGGNKGPSKAGSQVYLQTEYEVKGLEQRCYVRDSH